MNAIAPAFICSAGGMRFQDALERVLRLVSAPLGTEHVPLTLSSGRVLTETFEARLSLPGFDQSAMDGYAVRCSDVTPGADLPITGRTVAGDAPGCLHPGSAHRILTGAPLPIGADAVVAQESVHFDGDVVRIMALPTAGTNVRHCGQDIQPGDALISCGTILDWRHIAVLAAQGAAGVIVRRRPRVALLSSGRELRALGEGLMAGQIHDSNLPMLANLLTTWGAVVDPRLVSGDDAVSMHEALKEAAEGADLVLTTAGISVGDEDYVRSALEALGGDLAVIKVAMKPGKPLAAGRLGSAAFVGLPGNPQASLAGAVGFVRPLLAKMMGLPVPRPLQALAGFDMHRKLGRAEFILVRLRLSSARAWADRVGPDGSARLAPMLAATGFAFLPEETGAVRRGALLEVIPFKDYGIFQDQYSIGQETP